MADEILSIKAAIRNVPDFPVPGVLFKDITPILRDPGLLSTAVEALSAYARTREAQVIAGIESRGFILGAPVAMALGIPFVPVRKAGKLPWDTIKASYERYGTAEIEVHRALVLARGWSSSTIFSRPVAACAACESWANGRCSGRMWFPHRAHSERCGQAAQYVQALRFGAGE